MPAGLVNDSAQPAQQPERCCNGTEHLDTGVTHIAQVVYYLWAADLRMS